MAIRRSAAVLTVLISIAIVYWQAVAAYFFDDDFNWLTRTWFFTPANIFNLSTYDHFYRPVIEMYFWAAIPLFGGSASLFHVANIVLHAVNVLLLFVIARQLFSSERAGFLAALFFAVLPGHVEAIAWVGALAEPIAAIFGCVSLLALWRSLERSSVAWRVLSVVSYALALLTHESSVVFLVILAGGYLVRLKADTTSPRQPDSTSVRLVVPYVVVTVLYLAIDIPINSRSYLVGEDHWKLGFHIVRNALDYVVTLHVGSRSVVSYVAIAVVLVLLLVRGNARVRFATVWMLVAMAPFVPFTWGTSSRYLYLPAMGFALLLAEGFEWLDRTLRARLGPAPRHAIVAVLAAAVAIRFMVFAVEEVEHFAERAERYRTYLADLRARHPTLPNDAQVTVDAATEKVLPHRFLQAAIQWEYRDPSLRVVVQ
jgi:hypothetical protein